MISRFSRNLKVHKIEPRSRSKIEGLWGRLGAFIEVSGDGLHVGSRQLILKIDENRARRSLETLGWEKTTEELVKSLPRLDPEPFCTTGGKPVVPASTVKGNIRARLELSFKATDGGVRSCFVASKRRGRTNERRRRNSWRHRRIWRTAEDIRSACRFNPEKEEGKRVCLICDLFGTSGLIGIISFSDFVGEDVSLQDRSFGHGMRLSVAPKGSMFKGEISFRNLDPAELGLLFLGMGMKNRREGREVLLGRLRYRGPLGKIKYGLDCFLLSPFSKEINLNGLEIRLGQSVKEESDLNKLVQELVAVAKEKFGRELELIDEVKKVGGG